MSWGERIIVGLVGTGILGCGAMSALLGGWYMFHQLWNPDSPMENAYGWRAAGGALGLIVWCLAFIGIMLILALWDWVLHGTLTYLN